MSPFGCFFSRLSNCWFLLTLGYAFSDLAKFTGSLWDGQGGTEGCTPHHVSHPHINSVIKPIYNNSWHVQVMSETSAPDNRIVFSCLDWLRKGMGKVPGGSFSRTILKGQGGCLPVFQGHYPSLKQWPRHELQGKGPREFAKVVIMQRRCTQGLNNCLKTSTTDILPF